MLNMLHLIPFTNEAIYGLFSIYALINLFIFLKRKKTILEKFEKRIKVVLISELLFSFGLVVWSLVRGFQPDIVGLEKLMDLGFINSILNTRYLPPADMWFSGESINYYWFGHFIIALITKASKIQSSITFNLSLASIMGLTLASSFSIVSTLVKRAIKKADKRVAMAAGLISALLLTFGGNFHAPIYIVKEGVQNYWYPNATRFIGYNPETNDKTIHEFPIYSFVVSDLHAHLINLPFVLLYIALLMNYVVNANSKPHSQNPKQTQNSKLFRKFDIGALKLELRNSLSKLIPLGFLLGVMFMTSTWDFGNYLLVSGVTFLLFNLKKYRLTAKTLWLTGKPLIIIVFISFLTALPFILNFTSLAEGIRLVTHRTPLWQLGVLWGFPAILTLLFSIFIYKFRSNIKAADIFIVSLLIAAWMLIFIPEIVFVKDIYIASHQRANTMFKLTYQAYVMTYLSSGYITVRLLSWTKKIIVRSLLFIFFLIIFAAVLTYPSFAINSYYGDLKNYHGLNGETWLKSRYQSVYETILWLRENTKGQPVILEAPGDSYTDYNLISSYTGFPTVSGWYVHEWLWRGSPDFPQKRVEDITQIYISSDKDLTKLLLEKYKVEYVIVGTLERQKYPNINEEKFRELGTLVFSSGNSTIYKIN